MIGRAARAARSAGAPWVLFALLASSAPTLPATGPAPPGAVTGGGAAGATQAGERVERERWRELLDLVRDGDRRAIPRLEEMFGAATDRIQKQRIALLLVRLLDEDARYFDYLAAQARAAIDGTAPYPQAFDRQGRSIRGTFSDAFLAWCRQHGAMPEGAARDALYGLPADVMLLGRTGDSRSFDLLARGLASPNYAIAAQAALGLARIDDRRAIRAIREAAAKMPAEMGPLLARALAYFDDPEALDAARRLVGDEALLQALIQDAERDKRAGETLEGWFE